MALLLQKTGAVFGAVACFAGEGECLAEPGRIQPRRRAAAACRRRAGRGRRCLVRCGAHRRGARIRRFGRDPWSSCARLPAPPSTGRPGSSARPPEAAPVRRPLRDAACREASCWGAVWRPVRTGALGRWPKGFRRSWRRSCAGGAPRDSPGLPGAARRACALPLSDDALAPGVRGPYVRRHDRCPTA